MQIILACGNPGPRHNFTRHNFGFLALDFYAKRHALSWQERPKFRALTAKSDNFLLVKPLTFYNDVGQSAIAITHFYKLSPQDLLVVCDDFNLDFGKLRFRKQGSDGGNNGLKSLIATLNTSNFPRLRLGTANDPLRRQLGDTDFVLSRFTPEERAQLPAILQNITLCLDDYRKTKN